MIKGRFKGTHQIVYISYVVFGGQHYFISFLCFSVQRGPGTTCIASEGFYVESCLLAGRKTVIKIMIKALTLSGFQYMWV